MADYKELLDFEIKKRIKKIVKKYHNNTYDDIKYLSDAVKAKIKADLMIELSLNKVQVDALVEENITINIRKKLLNLVGLGYQSDYYAILSFCKAIKRLFILNIFVPLTLLFGIFIGILSLTLIIQFENVCLILLIIFTAIYFVLLSLLFYNYRYVFINNNNLINDRLIDNNVKIYKCKYLTTPYYDLKDALINSRYCTDICLLILYYLDSNGNKNKLLYIPANINLGYYEYKRIRLIKKFFKTLTSRISVSYYRKTKFLVFTSINLEKKMNRFIIKNEKL